MSKLIRNNELLLSLKKISITILIIIGFSRCSNTKYKVEDHQVFRYNQYSNITSLDPAFARNVGTIWASNQVFNSLVQLDSILQIKADIAHSWKISTDQKTYTFYLRDDVFFHKNNCFKTKDQTRKVQAQDFVYSFNRLRDPKVASPGNWVLQQVDSYKAINETTLEITLKKPFPAFLGLLSMRYCSVVPKEAVDYYKGNFRSHAVGTGPFYIKFWEENTKLILRKNPLYFEKDQKGKQLPYLEAVAISFIPDKQSEFLGFVQKRFDLLNSLDSSYKDELLTPQGKLQPKYQGKIQFEKAPYLNTEYIGFYLDAKNSPLQSLKFRQAINMGFDRVKMIKFLKNDIGTPAINGMIPKGMGGFTAQKGYEYNPKKAIDLINQYKKEFNDNKPSLHIATNSNYQNICEYIQRELEKIGVNIIVDVMPSATLRKEKWKGNLEGFRASWIADYPDAENYMSLFYSKNHTPNGPNYAHFTDQELDILYEKSFKISDPILRNKLYTKMDSIVIAKAPVIPLYYDQAVHFTQNNVHGIELNAQNFLVLKRAWKEK